MIALTILDVIGYFSTIIVILGIISGLIAWFTGILPALKRLGMGFARRKIAIFARSEHLDVLNNLLLDSKLFKKKNIINISSVPDLGRSKQATLFLVFWEDWQDKIGDILDRKEEGNALIIYAPPRSIPDDIMKKIDEKQNAIVTNFRGRLLNDIVVSMIATDYR
jgi:hypothetical protein